MRRKTFLHAAAVLAIALSATPSLAGVPIESQNLQDLYRAALAEGGSLVVYAGGDTAGQQDGFKAAFEKQFPGVTLQVVVDYSKFHNARLEYQFARNQVKADLVMLQTLQDFPRWKAQGRLLNYKPAGWDAVYSDFKDKDGAFVGVFVDAFSNVVNTKQLTPEQIPTEMRDYLKPALKGRIVTTYPNDDDAVLYWFKLAVDKYGWDFVHQFKAQNGYFVRGTQAPADDVESGKAAATFSTDGMLTPDASAQSRFVLPKSDPFVSWAQRAAILKQAAHPAAAKLYLNWLLDKETQKNVWYMWSSRTDVPAPVGYKPIWQYRNTDVNGFEKFIHQREAVELFRQQITLILGEVKGEPSPGLPGLLPTRALPH